MSETQASLLQFPCDFPIKVFGKNREDWAESVWQTVRRHAPELPREALTSRLSGGGKYLAVTITLHAQSQEQLDAIYRELSASPETIMAL